MNIDSFLTHYQLGQNPFGAEEARHDPVFERAADLRTTHPDFPKILGRLDKPATAVVFGEKGSGKTAMRLLIGKQVAQHNREHPDQRVLIVAYDDFNPVLDNLLRDRKQKSQEVLREFRLDDHQDAILSRAVTKLVDALLGQPTDGGEEVLLPDDLDKLIKRLPRQIRVDLAVLAALYDQPRSGDMASRWRHLRGKLKLLWQIPLSAARHTASALTLIAAALGIAVWWEGDQAPLWLLAALGLTAAGTLLLWGYWMWRAVKLWWLAKLIRREMPAIRRTNKELTQMLSELSSADLARQPLPTFKASKKTPTDSRYQLTRHLIDVLGRLGYVGMIVLVDRVDEPTLISGDPERMKALVWPMFDNKFLQQGGVGLKLLLPLELRHMLHRETAAFFQEARLDKQNMIDRLNWSGATLYDLCSSRLKAVRPDSAEPITLTDLFESGVTRETLVDALDQMHQPRDAFKFLYSVIQEHCKMVPEEEAAFQIPKLTLESVRRSQSQRVQELYRGLSPT